jgi:hypothetical protein
LRAGTSTTFPEDLILSQPTPIMVMAKTLPNGRLHNKSEVFWECQPGFGCM